MQISAAYRAVHLHETEFLKSALSWTLLVTFFFPPISPFLRTFSDKGSFRGFLRQDCPE